MTCRPRSTNMTSILPIHTDKARDGSKVPAHESFMYRGHEKAHRSGTWTDAPMRAIWRWLPVFFDAGFGQNLSSNSEPIQDLVGPETLEPMQRLVERGEFLVGDAADLLHGLDVLLVQRLDDAADFLA